MSAFNLKIDTGNAAFEDDPGEIARILKELSDRLADGVAANTHGYLRDINGNMVGHWSIGRRRRL